MNDTNLKLELSYKILSLFAYRIFSEDLKKFDLTNHKGKLLISTLNPHSFYVAEHDPLFKEALLNSTILLPDGIGIVIANWLLNFSRIPKIAGIDVFEYLLTELDASSIPSHKRVYFLGSTDSNLLVIKQKIVKDFPSLTVGIYSPLFKPEFSKTELDAMINAVNDFAPHVLFVGMTAPRQEKWAYQNFSSLNTSIVCSIGAVFDFYSGRIKRPSIIWQQLGLEWLGRFLREPFRLWRRTLISMPYFMGRVLLEFIKKSFTKEPQLK